MIEHHETRDGKDDPEEVMAAAIAEKDPARRAGIIAMFCAQTFDVMWCHSADPDDRGIAPPCGYRVSVGVTVPVGDGHEARVSAYSNHLEPGDAPEDELAAIEIHHFNATAASTAKKYGLAMKFLDESDLLRALRDRAARPRPMPRQRRRRPGR